MTTSRTVEAPYIRHTKTPLRQIGLIGEPVWTTQGAVVAYEEQARYSGVPVTFNGTWYNWLKSVSPQTPASMGLIPKEIRNQAKAAIAKLTDTKFVGMVLTIERKKDRLIARTTQGNLFGFIQNGHESRLGGQWTWRIEWATATDGNVHAILRPHAVRLTQLSLSLPPCASTARRENKRLAKERAKQLALELQFEKKKRSTRAEAVQLSLFALAA